MQHNKNSLTMNKNEASSLVNETSKMVKKKTNRVTARNLIMLFIDDMVTNSTLADESTHKFRAPGTIAIYKQGCKHLSGSIL